MDKRAKMDKINHGEHHNLLIITRALTENYVLVIEIIGTFFHLWFRSLQQ